MGNHKSRDYVVNLTEAQVNELSTKTKYKPEEIQKLHAEFMVGEFFLLLLLLMNILLDFICKQNKKYKARLSERETGQKVVQEDLQGALSVR